MAEQLLFTWADRGLEGRGMAQIVNATERLYEHLPTVRRQARELCTTFSYPSPWRDPATAPVSYGWRDLDGLRYAFRRRYTGTDAFGRPGVFAAHILVDRPERLPAAALLERAGPDSPTWWDGSPATGDWLPPVSLDEFKPAGPAPAPQAGDDVTAAVLTAVLAHTGRPVLLAIGTTALVAALRRIAPLLPGALDELSISTYEPPATRTGYDLAATSPPDDDPMAIPVGALLADPGVGLPRRIARLALEPALTSRTYVSHAWDATRTAGPAYRHGFLAAGHAYLTLRGPADPRPDELLPALRDPRTAADLLDEARARTVVARGLGAGDARTVDALRGAGHRLGTEIWTALGTLTADAATTADGLAAAWRLLKPVTPDGAAAFTARLVQLAAADPARVRHWPAAMLPDAARHPEVPATPALRTAVIAAGTRTVLQLAADPGMPGDLWAAMLTQALNTRAVDAGRAARAVAAHETLARAVAAAVPAQHLRGLLDTLAPAEALLTLSRWVSPDRADAGIDLAARLAARLSDADAWRAASIAGACQGTGWPALRDQALRRRLGHELADARAPRCGLLEIVRADLGPAGRAWHDYLGVIGTGERAASWPHHVRLLGIRAGGLPHPLQHLARRYALHDAVTQAPAADDIAEAVAVLNTTEPPETAELVLRAGRRATLALQRPEAGFNALLYVALHLVEPQIVRTLRNGRLARPGAQDTAAKLYLSLLPHDRDLGPRCQLWTAGHARAERWLRGLHPG
ncbi:hypothetical protein [Dactylosporangium sp. CS-033363]|uniref:GAP1-N2 domain-containing protein n=1 Tax=Dactylosporangium sp. CS-033363 TaxID=3239935 RepID=UPI003D920B69